MMAIMSVTPSAWRVGLNVRQDLDHVLRGTLQAV